MDSYSTHVTEVQREDNTSGHDGHVLGASEEIQRDFCCRSALQAWKLGGMFKLADDKSTACTE
jgi:hypothetical protein